MSTFSNTPIKEFMTKNPHGVDPGETLEFALKKMLDLNIRHLPVRSGGHLVGMISQRDIQLVDKLEKSDLSDTLIGTVMTTQPYAVGENTPLSSVVSEMEASNYGSALIVDSEKKVLGIFTETDAIKALKKVIA